MKCSGVVDAGAIFIRFLVVMPIITEEYKTAVYLALGYLPRCTELDLHNVQALLAIKLMAKYVEKRRH